MMYDILIFGATKTEHNVRLHAVLDSLKPAGVTLNRAKCSCAVREGAFLGYIVDTTGIRPDPKKKVQAIKEMATPSSVADVRRFLGMINYLARFVPNLAEISVSYL